MYRRHAVVPVSHAEPGRHRGSGRLILAVEDLEHLVEQRQMPTAKPCVRPRDIDPAVPGDVVDHVSAAERLVDAVDAIRIEVVECTGIENADLCPIDSSPDIANAEIDLADSGQHPGFVGRIKPAVMIYDDIVGGEEVRVANVDVAVGPEAERTFKHWLK